MKPSKILFIGNLSHSYNSLKFLSEAEVKNLTELYGSSNLPLGILSIQAYVKKYCNGLESKIIDLNTQFLIKIRSGDINKKLKDIVCNFEGFLFSDIKPVIEAFKPDIVAISSLFDKSIPTLIMLAEGIRWLSKDCIIVAGGHPVNNLYIEILSATDAIDAACMGEGEIPFCRLINSLDRKNFIKKSNYFMTKEKSKNDETDIKIELVENLDDIPFYDYDDFFIKYSDKVLSLHNNVLDSKHSFNRQAVIMTSRGCPYSCIFCASSEIHSKRMRVNSIDRVKRELDFWVDDKKVDTIGFIDDHILFDVDRAIEITDYAGSKGVDIRFPNGLAIAPINKEFVEACKRNNVKELQLAIESGSERVLREIIKKPLTLKRAEEVLNMFLDTEIFLKIFLVVGFPEETLEDINESLSFLRTANFHWASISAPTPISGSRLLKDSLSKGYLDEYNYEDLSFFQNKFENKEVAAAMNGNIRYTMNLDINFVHNPYMRMGKYHLAKDRFEAIIKNYRDHAFAFYYLAQCQKRLGEGDNSLAIKQFYEIIEKDKEWLKYANYFKLV